MTDRIGSRSFEDVRVNVREQWRRRLAAGLRTLAVCAGVVFASCSASDGPETVVTTRQALAENEFEMAFPPIAIGTAAPVTALEALIVQDRGRVRDASGAFVPVATLGTGVTEIGADADVGPLFARGAVRLRSRAEVHGDLRGRFTPDLQAGARVLGQTLIDFGLARPSVVSFVVTFPTSSLGPLEVPNDTTRDVGPGRYDSMVVRARSTLRLTAGTHYVNDFSLEPNATLLVDSSAGPVFLYVKSALRLEGSVTGVAGAMPDFATGYFGTSDVLITGPYSGALIARSAHLNFSSQRHHRGLFFAKRISVGPDTTIEFVPFLPTAFEVEGGGIIGQCDNNVFPAESTKVVCLRSREPDATSVEMTLNGAPVPATGDCVSVTVVEPSVELRAFQLRADGTLARSDLALLTTHGNASQCPFVGNVVSGELAGEFLVSRVEGGLVSGGPGNDYLVAHHAGNVLIGGPGADVFDLSALTAALAEVPGLGGTVLYTDTQDRIVTNLRTIDELLTTDIRIIGPLVDLVISRLAPSSFAKSYFIEPDDPHASAAQDPLYTATDLSVTTADPGVVVSAFHFRVGCRLVDLGLSPDSCFKVNPCDDPVCPPPQEVDCSFLSNLSCSATQERAFSEIIKLNPAGDLVWAYQHPVSDHIVRSVRELKDYRGALLGYVASGESGSNPQCSVEGEPFTFSCCPEARAGGCPGPIKAEQAFLLFLTPEGEFEKIVYHDGRYFAGDSSCCTFQGEPGPSSFLRVEPIPITDSSAVPDLVAVGYTKATGSAATGPGTAIATGTEFKALAVRFKIDGTPFAARAYSKGPGRFDGIAFVGSDVFFSGSVLKTDPEDTGDVLVASAELRPTASFGKLNWLKTLDGGGTEVSRAAVGVGDGAVITGFTDSFAAADNPNRDSAFLVKLDANGALAFSGGGDPSPAYNPPSGWRLFGGYAGRADGYGVAAIDGGKGGFLISGMISQDWLPALNERPPGALEREASRTHALLIRTDANGRSVQALAGAPTWIQSFGHSVDEDGISRHLWQSQFFSVAAAPDGGAIAAGYDTNCAAFPEQTARPCLHPFVVKMLATGAPPCSCSDDIFQPACGETGRDCGPACGVDCTSCSDCMKNGSESGVDCGGAHAYSGEVCPACPNTTGNCPANCSDGLQNGDETGVDCGGATCTACPISGAQIFQRNCQGCHGSTGCNGFAPANAGATCFDCVRNQILHPKGGMPQTISDEAEIAAVFAYLSGLDTSGCQPNPSSPNLAACTTSSDCRAAASGEPVVCGAEGICFRCRGACE